MEEKIKKNYSISISDKITINGVESIVSVTDKNVEIKLYDRRLYLTGSGFAPTLLDLEKGLLILSGEVNSLKLGLGKDGFVKKLFK